MVVFLLRVINHLAMTLVTIKTTIVAKPKAIIKAARQLYPVVTRIAMEIKHSSSGKENLSHSLNCREVTTTHQIVTGLADAVSSTPGEGTSSGEGMESKVPLIDFEKEEYRRC